MSKRIIEPFEFYGKTVYIEVTQVESYPARAGGAGLSLSAQAAGEGGQASSAGEAVRDTIAALAEAVQHGLGHLHPEEWKMEVNIGFQEETRVPFLVGSESNAVLKVTATWKTTSEKR